MYTTAAPRIDRLERHEGQVGYYMAPERFNLNHAGRRSGKSEIAKRRLVKRAQKGRSGYRDARYAACAPVFRQAKAIYWDDLQRMIHPDAVVSVSQSTLTIRLWHGGELFVAGMDQPDRIEGAPIDHILLDEYGNMKPSVWTENVLPALATRGRPGTADLIGVPEGRNHYYKLAETAKHDPAWGYHHWRSDTVLPPAEIALMRARLDDLTFEQEFGGEFVLFTGRAYYGFGEYSTAPLRDRYDPQQPLIVALDFNVAPGVAAIGQERPLPIEGEPIGTAWIGEVHIPSNSNTLLVCRRILSDWGDHKGRVEVYGDATGGARGTSAVQGSDWDLARSTLRKGHEEVAGFGDRVHLYVRPSNPPVRSRLNAVNSRFRSQAGDVRMMVDPVACPNVVRDFEGVATVEGGSGEIDKRKAEREGLSHLSDAIGYYVHERFPVHDAEWREVAVVY